jgi:hypothetical protein
MPKGESIILLSVQVEKNELNIENNAKKTMTLSDMRNGIIIGIKSKYDLFVYDKIWTKNCEEASYSCRTLRKIYMYSIYCKFKKSWCSG